MSDTPVRGNGVEAAGRQPDPRGVRVSLPWAEPGDPEPIVVEPPATPLRPSAPAAGVGLLGGLATGPASEGLDGASLPPTVDGHPTRATLDLLDGERAALRAAAGAPGHRVMLLESSPEASGNTSTTPSGVRRREVVVDGWRVVVDVVPAARAALRERARRGREEAGRSGPTEVRAIIPGVVVAVSIAPGDAVVAGQQLLVVEAMKMQNELRSPREGTIERVAVGAGATIEVGDLLLVIA